MTGNFIMVAIVNGVLTVLRKIIRKFVRKFIRKIVRKFGAATCHAENLTLKVCT